MKITCLDCNKVWEQRVTNGFLYSNKGVCKDCIDKRIKKEQDEIDKLSFMKSCINYAFDNHIDLFKYS